MRGAFVLVVIAVGCSHADGRSTPDSAREADGPDAHAAADASADAVEELTCHHTFRLDDEPSASSVWLTGSFVGWASDPSAGAVPFSPVLDGAWTVTYAFPPGTHQYKLIVDGSTWILDPTNPNTVDDGMGNTNNVYTCVL